MANRKSLRRSMSAACLIDNDLALIGEGLDSFEGNGVISTYAPRLRPNSPWRSQILENWVIVSVAYLSTYNLRCVLSREGEVNLYGPGGKPDHTFQIPEAGVFGEAATDLGYVNRIRAIGDSLYVCGMNRQVYRFFWDGHDLAAGQWRDIAGAMRQPPSSDPPDDDGEAFDQWLEENDSIDFVDIAGSSPSDIYAAGDEVWHFDGQDWRQLDMPTDESLSAIKVIDAAHVVMVGHNGTVLLGNATTGFTDLSSVDDNQNFVGVEWYDEKLFLASNFGLFTYDPKRKKIEKYITTLKPDLKDTHMLEAKDGLLWSFGFKDLAYFDSKTWTRVHHPDNDRVR